VSLADCANLREVNRLDSIAVGLLLGRVCGRPGQFGGGGVRLAAAPAFVTNMALNMTEAVGPAATDYATRKRRLFFRNRGEEEALGESGTRVGG